ncbi:hypothetical protein, partial [Staphylococcus warneri]|uniref:hypothetical protein n=1 Tax=Staphylococcus warneri TaxID=1292 RepID=UPI0011A95CAF
MREMSRGIDIVKREILVGDGGELFSEEIGMGKEKDIERLGYGMECGISSEDGVNDFMGECGRIIGYGCSGGF